MTKNVPNKIHIIGSVGSGKTTLARNLSKSYNIPFYELDNVVWKRCDSGDVRRTEKERDDYLDEIIRSEEWIIEGVHDHNWVEKSWRNANVIIFLDTPYFKRIRRITTRFFKQKLGLEKANYTPTLQIFWKMFKWNATFEKERKPEILKWLSANGLHTITLIDDSDINNIFRHKRTTPNR